MSTLRRCVLLDRDGVLNRDLPRGVLRPDELALLPGSAAAVARLRRAGYAVLLITSQSCVGRGWITPSELDTIHDQLRDELAIEGGRLDGIYACLHAPEAGCVCRKPAPGLIESARREWGFDPAVTWMVGDDVRDVQAALAAGVRPALVRTGKGEHSTRALPDVPVHDDLAAFVTWLLAGG
jgi:D-glycero-D-manno-heptose 1,7-bisphosphate phosphatase